MKAEGSVRRLKESRRLARAIGFAGLAAVVACSEPPPEVPPRQISESPFQYPEALWDAGVEGETLLELHLSERGTVNSARVERTSGHEEFDSAAVRDAHQLRFEPARRGQDSIAVRVLLPVQYSLQGPDTLNTSGFAETVPTEP